MSKVAPVILAAVTGFVAGILLAPKSGKETREDIKRKTLEARDYAVETAGVVRDKAAAGYAAARAGASEVGKEASEFAKRTGKRAGVVARDAKKTAGAVAGDVKSTASAVRDAVNE